MRKAVNQGRRGAVAGAAVAAIVAISPLHASPSASACSQPPPTLEKFVADPKGAGLPQAAFLDEAEKERSLADFRGSGLVVNFWATWCAPCVKEMPALDSLAKQLKNAGVIVLALSADREGAPVVRKFYDKNGITNLAVAIDRMSRLGRALEVSGLPTTVLFDAEGHMVGRVVGAAEWDAPATVSFLRGCLAPAA
jgi:thiol-disulfide isomerase/thioredoxin